MKGVQGEGEGGVLVLVKVSPGYYGLCTLGGMLSAGTSHLLMTPFDVLKVNMQVNSMKYNSIPLGSLPCGKSKALLPSGEVGLASSLDTVFKVAVNLVSMNTSRCFTLMSWGIITGLAYTFLAVHLLKFLLM